jgi:predicted TIM-barrel fold metal-dependent hydrolase
MILDVHTHAFPDFLAPKAMEVLSAPLGEWKPVRDGTLRSLEASMAEAGVHRAFVANIATRPEQGPSILSWSQAIASDSIVPLGSVHPLSSNWADELEAIAKAGLPGLKLHAQFQRFVIDADEMFPIYEKAADLGLFILFHAGFDIAFPGDESSAPRRLAQVRRRVKNLVMVAAHVGGWQAWDEVVEHLVGSDVYLDTSYIDQLSPVQLDRILSRHSLEHLLFASDTPWLSQNACLKTVRALPLGPSDVERILGQNALALHPSLRRLQTSPTTEQVRDCPL